MDQTPFTFAGQCDDEVVFTFYNTDKQLFVSRNFLSLVSPVFRTIFTSDYKEKGTDVAEMKDKDYENVFEFLLLLHPCTQKSVSGQCDDEVVFTFYNTDKQLFVSRNFLSLVSPVFRTIFTSDYKEKGTDVAEMKDKDYENVFEFLLLLHPCTQKSVSENNVYSVRCLAEEYEVKTLIQRCKSVLSQILVEKFKVIKNPEESEFRKTEAAHVCIMVLSTSLAYDYYELKTEALKTISRFGSKVFLKVDVWGNDHSIFHRSAIENQLFGFFGDNWLDHWSGVESKRQECRNVYNTLPDEVKTTILQNRVDLLEDDKIH